EEAAMFTIVANVNAGTPNNTTINNSVTATSTTPDGTMGNNTGSASTMVNGRADLMVTKTDSTDPTCVNGNITYTINFTNIGPGSSLNTTVTDPVPSGTTLISASNSSPGWSRTDSVSAGG